jgi:transcription termination factor NusB
MDMSFEQFKKDMVNSKGKDEILEFLEEKYHNKSLSFKLDVTSEDKEFEKFLKKMMVDKKEELDNFLQSLFVKYLRENS